MIEDRIENALSKRRWLALVTLAAITIVIFGQTLSFDFVSWDDKFHIYENEDLRNVAESRTSVFSFLKKPNEIPLAYMTWSLLAKASHVFPYGIRRGELNASLFHGFNVLLHTANAFLVYLILLGLLKRRTLALAGALLFAVHPIQVEAVAWVSGTKELLSSFWILVTFAIYLRWSANSSTTKAKLDQRLPEKTPNGNLSRKERRLQQRNKKRTQKKAVKDDPKPNGASDRRYLYPVAMTIAWILGMLSKTTAVVALPLILGADILLHRATIKKRLPLYAVWSGFAILALILTKAIQPDEQVTYVPSLIQRFFVAGDAFAFYLYKIMLPLRFTIDYTRTPLKVLNEHTAYATSLATLLIFSVAILTRKFRQITRLGLLAYTAGLLPTLGFVPFLFQNHSTVADRYAYLSMLGISLLVATLAGKIAVRLRVPALALVILALTTVSGLQARHWRNSVSLYEHALTIDENNDMAYHNIGREFADQKQYEKAISYYRKAIDLDPRHVEAYRSMGLAYSNLGRYDSAVVCYKEAVRMKPDFGECHYLFANTYQEMGDPGNAIKHYRSAIAANTRDDRAYNNMANSLLALGDTVGAIASYRKALAIRPLNTGYRLNLDRIQNKAKVAAPNETAFDTTSKSTVELNALGVRFATAGNYKEAAHVFDKVLRMDSLNAEALSNSANIAFLLGDYEKALALYDKTIATSPNSYNAHYNKGVALHRLNRLNEAIQEYRIAYQKNPGNRKARQALEGLGDSP